MPKKPKLTADKLDCRYCGDVQDVAVIEDLFEKTGNTYTVTTYCKSCNGKLLAYFSVNGFYSFYKFNPDLKIRYNLKQKQK